MTMPSTVLTWANLLTLVRLAAAAPTAWAIATGQWHAAAAWFALAAVSDFADGRVARRWGQASPLGGLFDHATDAAYVTITLAACAGMGLVPWPLAALIPAAFIQYTLDSRALGGRPLRTSPIGRLNGIAYFVLAGVAIGREALAFDGLPRSAVAAFGWLLVASTMVSMVERWLAWRRLES
jgi:cardiolipin synthase